MCNMIKCTNNANIEWNKKSVNAFVAAKNSKENKQAHTIVMNPGVNT